MWLHFPHLKFKILSNLIIYIYIVQVPSFFLGIHWSFHPCLLLLHLSSLVKWNCRCYNFQVRCRSKLQLVSFILWHGVFLLILLSYTTCRMLTDVDGLPNEVNGIQSGKSAYRNTFQNFDSVALFTKKKLTNLRKTSNVRKILFLEHDTQKTLKTFCGVQPQSGY